MMVMKKVIKRPLARRLSVAEAKAELSAALRAASDVPTVIHSRGRDLAVLLGIDAYQRLVALNDERESRVKQFLDDVAVLKERLGGGAELGIEAATFAPRDPFAARVRR